MSGEIRAIAVDFDGTLTATGHPAPEVLGAIDRVRARGLRVVLVTGRILDELLDVFPEALDHFDTVVAENGAVLAAADHERTLSPPVDDAIDKALASRGIAFRRGLVILAVSANANDQAVYETIGCCGLDCQVARNRGELMVVPAGVSKATGLTQALAAFGISTHSAVAIGDAENDLAMLDACELGVAVANAVPSLAERADLVLGEPDGSGVRSLLEGPLGDGDLPLRSHRWHVTLGNRDDGSWVRIPAAGIDLLVVGGSGSGKSFSAGLVAEQLVALGYVLCVIDPEGDHAALASLPRTASLGGSATPPDPDDVARILRHSLTSVVVDLSLVSAPERDEWVCRLLGLLEGQRATHGVPHWLLIDEAHAPLGRRPGVTACPECIRTERKGHCLVTYRPDELTRATLSGLDYVLLHASDDGVDRDSLEAVQRVSGVPPQALEAQAVGLRFGDALLVRAGEPPDVQRLVLSSRWVRHVRHWHKYASSQLPAERRFVFRHPSGAVVGVAGNLVEFHRLVHRCDVDTLSRHSRASDFSRWLRDVIGDAGLADAFSALEKPIANGRSRPEVQDARMAMVAAVEQRYE